MPQLPDKPTLKDFQSYVDALVHERGFDKETLPELFMMFLEECGEMARAARKSTDMKVHEGKELADVEHEIADVFIYFLDICNKLGVDLETAFRNKEAINKQRTWR
jgi:NTP pyrophosphatase (non-canonical NTP hydrolase)